MSDHCALGVGCDETGVCYAAAHGEPDRCGRSDPPVARVFRVGTPPRPCRSPYCECEPGRCTHPGCFDARGT